ncbi:MAG: hypothetical protein KQI62_20325 [Deltaproteobacteria bacterium]|nr:hypothetical protein [Deltaproteobacteria bacterium]
MSRHRLAAEELIIKAEAFEGVRAGIVGVQELLSSPSYQCLSQGDWRDSHPEKAVTWLPKARSLLVLAMHHPPDHPSMDWFYRSNSPGNRRMYEISEKLAAWLLQAHNLHAMSLPYQQEQGGVFLKDAAVLAGLGVVGKNNLLLTPQWGPNVRLRAVLIQEQLPAGSPLNDFQPCLGCDMPCLSACPQEAFGSGQYHRPACIQRLEKDRTNPFDGGQSDPQGKPIMVIDFCRRCEFACRLSQSSPTAKQ